MDLIKLANDNEGFVMAMLATASFLATLAAIVLSRSANKLSEKNIAQTLEIERERSRPYVVFDIEYRSSLIFAVVKNIGQTGAYDVSINTKPQLERGPNSKTRKLSLTTKTISFLAPGRELSDFISAHHVFYEQYSSPVFSGVISYKDSAGKPYKENLALDLNYLKDLAVIIIPDIPSEMKKLVEEVHHISGTAKKMHQHMTRDFRESKDS